MDFREDMEAHIGEERRAYKGNPSNMSNAFVEKMVRHLGQCYC